MTRTRSFSVFGGQSALSADGVEGAAQGEDADDGRPDEERVAEEVPRDPREGAPQAVALKLHVEGVTSKGGLPQDED